MKLKVNEEELEFSREKKFKKCERTCSKTCATAGKL